jgi:hypothetical protein
VRVCVCVCVRVRERERQTDRQTDRVRDWGRYENDNVRTKGWGLLFTTVRQQKLTPGDGVC